MGNLQNIRKPYFRFEGQSLLGTVLEYCVDTEEGSHDLASFALK